MEAHACIPMIVVRFCKIMIVVVEVIIVSKKEDMKRSNTVLSYGNTVRYCYIFQLLDSIARNLHRLKKMIIKNLCSIRVP